MPGTTLGAPGSATVFIEDNDDAIESGAYVGFAEPVASELEGAGEMTISVVRSGQTDLSFAVSYFTVEEPVGSDDPNAQPTADGAATAGVDFTPVSGTLSFAAGETTKSFAIPLIDDGFRERNEVFSVLLHDPTAGALLGAHTFLKAVIVDDDHQPIVLSPLILEADGTAVLRFGNEDGQPLHPEDVPWFEAQVSEVLDDWQVLPDSLEWKPDGHIQIVDENALLHHRRFYRVRGEDP